MSAPEGSGLRGTHRRSTSCRKTKLLYRLSRALDAAYSLHDSFCVGMILFDVCKGDGCESTMPTNDEQIDYHRNLRSRVYFLQSKGHSILSAYQQAMMHDAPSFRQAIAEWVPEPGFEWCHGLLMILLEPDVFMRGYAYMALDYLEELEAQGDI